MMREITHSSIRCSLIHDLSSLHQNQIVTHVEDLGLRLMDGAHHSAGVVALESELLQQFHH